jgi:hypothetical protein
MLPEVVDGILKSQRNSYTRLIEGLQDLQFVTRSITVTKSESTIELQVLDDSLFFQLLSGEANNFLLASLVSYERSFQKQEKNAAWQTIEHYYSAYYAIHYLLRITGTSLTNLDITATNNILRNQDGPTKLSEFPSGLYTLTYDDKSKTIYLRKNLKKGSGGSHIDAWHLWEDLVSKMQANTTKDIAEYINESVDLSTHKKYLIRSTGKYSPPEVRGEINYQFKGGTWIFEKNSQKSVQRLQSAIQDSSMTINSALVNPETLISNNKIIVHLAKTAFLHSADKYPKSICRSLKNKYSTYMSNVT